MKNKSHLTPDYFMEKEIPIGNCLKNELMDFFFDTIIQGDGLVSYEQVLRIYCDHVDGTCFMHQKIKIIRIFSRLNIGGPAIHTILLTQGLNNEKFESLLVKGSEDPFEGDMVYLAKEKGVNPVVIPELQREISLIKDIIACYKIYRLIAKEQPHVIHTHTAKAGFIGRFAGIAYNFIQKFQFHRKSNSVKIVHTFHGHVFHGYFNPLKTKIFLWIERFLALYTDKIITVSAKQKREILHYGVGNEKKVATIPLGLDLSRFLDTKKFKGHLRRELGLSHEILLIGIVARLVPIKNHRLFINAISALVKSHATFHFKALIVGDGELRKELEDFVTEKGLGEYFIFLGFRIDLEMIYSDLDIVVLSSLNEGSPVALIEAMMACSPVISTNVGGVSDLLVPNDQTKRAVSKRGVTFADCGILVETEDASGLAWGITQLAEDEELRIGMGKEGRKAVWPRYDISMLLNNVGALYKELLNFGSPQKEVKEKPVQVNR